jgi:hypothetical protein
MQDAVAANHFRGWIGEEGIAVASGFAQLGGFIGGIDANGRDLNAVLMKFAEMLFETP